MKRLLLLACLFCLGASAQNLSTSGTISAASTANTCTATSCVYYQLPSGATWVTLQIAGTWSGSVGVYSITAQNATYQNLNSQTWTQQANLTANGTWAIAAGNSTFILVQSSSFSSGGANITMTASSTGSPLVNPILAGNLTVSGINQSTASTSGQCWSTQGGVASCGYGPGTVIPISSGGTGASTSSAALTNLFAGVTCSTGQAYSPASGTCINPAASAPGTNGQMLYSNNGAVGATSGITTSGGNSIAATGFLTGNAGVGNGGVSGLYGCTTFGDSNSVGYGLPNPSLSWANDVANAVCAGKYTSGGQAGDNAADFSLKGTVYPQAALSQSGANFIVIGTNNAKLSTATAPQLLSYKTSIEAALSLIASSSDGVFYVDNTSAFTPSGSWANVQPSANLSGIASVGTGYVVGDVVGISGAPGYAITITSTHPDGSVSSSNLTTVGYGAPPGFNATVPTTGGSGNGFELYGNFSQHSALVASSSGTITSQPLYVGPSGVVYLLYGQYASSSGTLSVTMDGTTALVDTETNSATLSSQTTGTPAANAATTTGIINMALARFSNIAQGTHTFAINATAQGTVYAMVFPSSNLKRGVGAPNATLAGVPPELNDAVAPYRTLYTQQSQAAVLETANDGFNTSFVDPNLRMNSQMDFLSSANALYPQCGYNPGTPLHFDYCGHAHLAEALLDASRAYGLPAEPLNVAGINANAPLGIQNGLNANALSISSITAITPGLSTYCNASNGCAYLGLNDTLYMNAYSSLIGFYANVSLVPSQWDNISGYYTNTGALPTLTSQINGVTDVNQYGLQLLAQGKNPNPGSTFPSYPLYLWSSIYNAGIEFTSITPGTGYTGNPIVSLTGQTCSVQPLITAGIINGGIYPVILVSGVCSVAGSLSVSGVSGGSGFSATVAVQNAGQLQSASVEYQGAYPTPFTTTTGAYQIVLPNSLGTIPNVVQIYSVGEGVQYTFHPDNTQGGSADISISNLTHKNEYQFPDCNGLCLLASPSFPQTWTALQTFSSGLTGGSSRKGTFVCTAGGTITVSNSNELATSDVVISLNTAGGTITTPPAMKTVTAGTGFTVLCGASDTSTYNYDILN